MKLFLSFCSIIATIETISCAVNSSSIPDISNAIDALSANVTSKLSDAKAAFKQKCNNLTGSDEAYDTAMTAGKEFKTCMVDILMEFTHLEQDIAEATPKGELDVVFNKYCHNRTIALECLNDFVLKLEPCLAAKEIEFEHMLLDIITKALDFICYKDGDMIPLFIAESGPECIKEHYANSFHCFTPLTAKYFPESGNTTLPQLLETADTCGELTTLQTCVVQELEKCVQPTPANLIDSLFKYVRKETVCKGKQ